jgi:hypothetical protein
VLDPERYSETGVADLLTSAAAGRIGVDRRLLSSILNRENAPADTLAYARSNREKDRLNVDPLLVDLFRYWRTPEALDFLIDVVRQEPDDVPDELIQTLLPFGERAVAPLIALYEELGEEKAGDVAFLLAGLHIRDERILGLLLERLEFDAADGAFCLGLYGDEAGREPLKKMLAEIPEAEVELRREISYAIDQLGAPPAVYEPEPFDILVEYPERSLPAFDILSEAERLDLLTSADVAVRAGAAHSFFNIEVSPKVRNALLELAKSDPDPFVRGRSWESLADTTEDSSIRDAMLAVLADTSRPAQERGGAAVGLYGVADQDNIRKAVEALYEDGGHARAKALEAMWRSLWEPYARFFPPSLHHPDKAIVREALRGAGYFQLKSEAEKIASFFHREDEMASLREDALFAYAMAMPGETTRGRVQGMLRKIDALAELDAEEAELVMFGLDERLRLNGLQPVFEEGAGEIEEPAPSTAQKVGRNDPCPCGSGKKYKKCHGA